MHYLVYPRDSAGRLECAPMARHRGCGPGMWPGDGTRGRGGADVGLGMRTWAWGRGPGDAGLGMWYSGACIPRGGLILDGSDTVLIGQDRIKDAGGAGESWRRCGMGRAPARHTGPG
jgi:hypothetical protein